MIWNQIHLDRDSNPIEKPTHEWIVVNNNNEIVASGKCIIGGPDAEYHDPSLRTPISYLKSRLKKHLRDTLTMKTRPVPEEWKEFVE